MKTYKDSNKTSGDFCEINKLMPDSYPLVCRQNDYDSLEDAQSDNEGLTVLSEASYNSLIESLEEENSYLIELRLLKIAEIALLNQQEEEEE